MTRRNANLVFLGFGVTTLFLHLCYPMQLQRLCLEDGVVEWVTAIGYLFSATFFCLACRSCNYKNIWHWGLAILTLVVFGEEISWGQRIFQITTPDILKTINVQQELNLHNIQGIHGNIRAIGLLIVGWVFFIVPLSHHFLKVMRNFYCARRVPIFPLWCLSLPTIGILFMAIPRLIFGTHFFRLDEVGELYLAFSWLLFSIHELSIVQNNCEQLSEI